jgi:hypothetical protein
MSFMSKLGKGLATAGKGLILGAKYVSDHPEVIATVATIAGHPEIAGAVALARPPKTSTEPPPEYQKQGLEVVEDILANRPPEMSWYEGAQPNIDEIVKHFGPRVKQLYWDLLHKLPEEKTELPSDSENLYLHGEPWLVEKLKERQDH